MLQYVVLQGRKRGNILIFEVLPACGEKGGKDIMKKRSIAKVMAAVMLLSLAAAPAAEAASFKSGAAGNAVLSGAMVQSVDKGKSYYDLLNDNSSNNSVRGTKSNPISVSVDLSDVLSDSGTVKESVKKEVVHIAAQVIATKYDANFGVISESGNSQVKASYEKNLNSGNSVSAVPALSSEQRTIPSLSVM